MSTVVRPIGDPLAWKAKGDSWRPAVGERVVMYGAGGFGRSGNEILRSAGAVVVHALDERGSRAASLPGVGVYRPRDDPLSLGERAGTTAVVGVFNRDAAPNEIDRVLRALGYAHVVSVPEF